jgi:hypothetical protein
MGEVVLFNDRKEFRNPGRGAREAVIAWLNAPAQHDFPVIKNEPEDTADGFLAFLWVEGFKVVPIGDDE